MPVLTVGFSLIPAGWATAQTFTNLHNFGGTNNGINPLAGLILSGNTLYGTASGGGKSGNGTVFAVSTNGTGFTNLYSFTATSGPLSTNSDGAKPNGSLILLGNTLYGTASGGGMSGNGTVFAINTDGPSFTNLHSFAADAYDSSITVTTNSDGISPVGRLILLGNTLYGTASGGGTNGYGTVFAVSTNGMGFTNLHTFTVIKYNGVNAGTNGDGINPDAGLLLLSNTLYGTAHSGGSFGNGTVFALNTNGTSFTNLHSFTSNISGNNDGAYPCGLISLGNTLYGTAVDGGSFGNGTVFALNTSGTVFTNLHSFTATSGSLSTNSDGANPNSLILSGNTLYGTAGGGGNSGNGTVFALSTNGASFTILYSFTASFYPNYTNSDGANPCGLVLSGNTLYGTASYGGTNGYGTLFSIPVPPPPPAQLIITTTLHSFTSASALVYYTNSDGANPNSLILSGNTLYGTAYNGGIVAGGTVFAVNTNGTGFTTLHSFIGDSGEPIGPSDGVNPNSLILSGNTLYGTASSFGSFGNGTVFACNTNDRGYTTLYSFTSDSNNTNSDGANPNSLILSGNTLYGTAEQGGSSGYGTVFAVNTNGTGFTTLHSFTGGSDGANPLGGLILSGTTLYGTASGGGSFGNGTVFAVNTDGMGFTNLYSFSFDGIDGGDPLGELILSGSTLYGTARTGGHFLNGTVFAVNTNGTGFTTLHSFTALYTNSLGVYTNSDGSLGFSDGAGPNKTGLILSGNTLYGTGWNGGSSGNGTVFALNTNGTGFTTLHSFTSDSNNTNSDGANPNSLILSGNTLYGTAYNGGSSGYGTVFSLSWPPLQLAIIPSAANVILTWPTYAPGVTLQFTTNLVSPVVWSTSSPSPVVFDGQNTVTNSISGTQMFFRLSQ